MKYKNQAHKEAYDKGQEAACMVSNFLNSHKEVPEGFVDYITRDHKLLQNYSMRLFLQCIWEWAETEHYTVQNAQVIEIAKQIKDAVNDLGYIPI